MTHKLEQLGQLPSPEGPRRPWFFLAITLIATLLWWGMLIALRWINSLIP